MKIVVMGTSPGGGAGHAAVRLVDGLRELGVDVSWVEPPGKGRLARHLAVSLQEFSLGQLRTPKSNTVFSTAWPVVDESENPVVAEAVVINLHWVARYQNPESIRRLSDLGKHIVWTMQDQRSFTGGCHFSAGCRGFTESCSACPQLDPSLHGMAEKLLREAKVNLGAIPITFVAPSHWVGNLVRQSAIFNEELHRVVHIPPGIDTDFFCPVESKQALRDKYGIPRDKIAVVTGAQSLGEHRKGFDLVRKALRTLESTVSEEARDNLVVVSYGEGALGNGGVEEVALGSLTIEEVAEVLQAGDLYFLMTREDVGPTVIIEAISCGLPVLAPNTGGIPEMVFEGRNGWLVEVEDFDGAAHVLGSIATEKPDLAKMGRESRKIALDVFANEKQAIAYHALFGSLLGEEKQSSGESGHHPLGGIPQENRFLMAKALKDFRFYCRVLLNGLYRTKLLVFGILAPRTIRRRRHRQRRSLPPGGKAGPS